MEDDRELRMALKVGDQVVLWPPFGSRSAPEIAPVERATKTQVVVGGTRFLRSRGEEVGVGPWESGYRIKPATPEHVAKVHQRLAEMDVEERKRRALRRLRSEELYTLPVEQLERLAEMADAALRDAR